MCSIHVLHAAVLFILVYQLQSTAAELTWKELIATKSWGGYGNYSISHLIALHDEPTCNRFASLLLSADPLIVDDIRREAKENNDQFVQILLSKWYSREGNSVPFTWRDLIQCMKDAGLDQHMVQIIERNILGMFCVGPSENNYMLVH